MGGEELVALDCGSGVGRIAEQLLLQHFQEVQLRVVCASCIQDMHTNTAQLVEGTTHSVVDLLHCDDPLQVDLIEPSEHLLQTAKENLAGPNRSRCSIATCCVCCGDTDIDDHKRITPAYKVP